MKLFKFLTFALSLSLLNACSDNNDTNVQTSAPTLTPQFANTDTLTKVLLSTSEGDIEIGLDSERAPITVKNFLAYTDKGFFSGTIFHRVIQDFMIQGGGYTANYQKKDTQLPIDNEADNGLRNEKYTIAMARTNNPHSATAQFFINTKNNGFLNHSSKSTQGWGYTVFGVVTKGHEIVDKINTVATGAGGPFRGDAPKTQVIIKSVQALEKK